MLPNATVPRGGYSGGGSVAAAAADRRGSLGSLSSCSNCCEVQGNGVWDYMLGVTQYQYDQTVSSVYSAVVGQAGSEKLLINN